MFGQLWASGGDLVQGTGQSGWPLRDTAWGLAPAQSPSCSSSSFPCNLEQVTPPPHLSFPICTEPGAGGVFTHAISGEAPLPRKRDLATRKRPVINQTGRRRGGHRASVVAPAHGGLWRSHVRAGPPESQTLVHPRPDPTWGLKGSFSLRVCHQTPQPLTHPQKAGCLFTLVAPCPQRPARDLAHSRCSVSVCGRGDGLGVRLTVQALRSTGAPHRQREGAGPVSGPQLGGHSPCLGQTSAGREPEWPQPFCDIWLYAEVDCGGNVYTMEIGKYHKPSICPQRAGC